MYPDVYAVAKGGLHEYGKKLAKEDGKLVWKPYPAESGDELFAVFMQTTFSHCIHIGVHITTLNQLANHKTWATRSLKFAS